MNDNLKKYKDEMNNNLKTFKDDISKKIIRWSNTVDLIYDSKLGFKTYILIAFGPDNKYLICLRNEDFTTPFWSSTSTTPIPILSQTNINYNKENVGYFGVTINTSISSSTTVNNNTNLAKGHLINENGRVLSGTFTDYTNMYRFIIMSIIATEGRRKLSIFVEQII